jgi:Uma2 family endonuclease
MQEPKPPEAPLTYAEFLAYAETHEGRFEFVDGQIVDMGIAGNPHQRVVKHLTNAIDAALTGTGCEALPTPAVWTLAGTRQRSPDVVVFCDDKPRKLVCEVMSPNRGEDLGDKRDEYEAMEEFQEYLVVDSVTHWVRVYRRKTNGRFTYVDHIGGTVRLDSIGYTLDIDALYRAAGIP